MRTTSPDSANEPGVVPNSGWADRILVALGLLFVVTLLVTGIIRDGFMGVWLWFQAMIVFVVFMLLVGKCDEYCKLYPQWTPTYRFMAVVSVLAGMGFAVLIVLTRWRPLF